MTFSGSCYLKLLESYMMPGRAPKHIWFQLPLPCGSCLQRPQRPRPQEALWAALAFFPPHPSALELCRTLTGAQANLFMPFRSFYHLGCFWLCSGFLLLLNKKPEDLVFWKSLLLCLLVLSQRRSAGRSCLGPFMWLQEMTAHTAPSSCLGDCSTRKLMWEIR